MTTTLDPSRRILLCTFGSMGDVHPYIALGRELARRGHQPIIATHEDFRAKVEAAGLGFHAVRPSGPPAEEMPEFMAGIMDARRGPETVVRDFIVAHFRHSYEDTLVAARSADLVLTHPLTFAAVAAAQTAGVPWASSVLAPMSFLSAYDPPALPLLPALAGLGWLGPRFWGWLFARSRRMVQEWMRPYHDLRAEIGLPPVADPMFEGQHAPGLVLAMFSRRMANPQPDWPRQTRVTGFCFHDRDTREDADLARLEAFLDDGPPPVVFTLGSSAVWNAGDFYRHSLDAVRALGCRAVFLIGSDARNVPTGDLPPGVAVFDYAPYSQLFPRAAAIVHQGGVGTTAQALRAGRPMLVVPFAFDQFDNARCVRRLGIARSIVASSYSPRRASAALRALLGDPDVAARAETVGRDVRDEDGPAAAAAALETMLSDSVPAR